MKLSGSPEVGKSGSPEDELKTEDSPESKVESLEPGGRPVPDISNPAFDTPTSAFTQSDIEHPKSEIAPTLTTHDSPLPMEVHHHPEVEKKGFKEYLLEGLMIFLAVMMGFFAESLRETITEHNKAKEYAVNLYSDLKLDTAELSGYLNYFRFAAANTDSLMQLLSTTDPKQIPSGKLYWFGLFGGAYHIFTPHDATLLEMQNSGSLRFFGDKTINRRLALYDEGCRSMRSSEDKEAGIYAETRKARARIFEYRYNEVANDIYHGMHGTNARGVTDPYGLKVASKFPKIDSFKKTNPPLLSYDKTLFNEYLEMVRSRFLYTKVQSADTLQRRAAELIDLLKKKYDLQDE